MTDEEYRAVAYAVACHGKVYIDAMGKTVYTLTMPKGAVPDTDIILGDGVQDWEAWVTDAHGNSPQLTVQVVY